MKGNPFADFFFSRTFCSLVFSLPEFNISLPDIFFYLNFSQTKANILTWSKLTPKQDISVLVTNVFSVTNRICQSISSELSTRGQKPKQSDV